MYYKYLVNFSIMHRNAAVLTILCILLCLTFNYTFPLHREGSKWFMEAYNNHSRMCNRLDHHDNIVDRTKNMANNIENAIRRIKDSTQDISKNIQLRLNNVKNSLSEEDLRQYEQLVLVKKYPYLDLKDIELKYGPSEKKIRQSVKFDTGNGNNYAGESSFCEPVEDTPNVEITNRGLSGFAIPAKIMKATKMLEVKENFRNNPKDLDDNAQYEKLKHNMKLNVLPPPDVLGSLHNDIVYYEEKKLK